MTKATRKWAVRISRDMVIITTGIIGLYHETFIADKPRDVLVWLFGGFVLGVPFLHQGDKQKDQAEKKELSSPEEKT